MCELFKEMTKDVKFLVLIFDAHSVLTSYCLIFPVTQFNKKLL